MLSTPMGGTASEPAAWQTRLVRADVSSGWDGRTWTSEVLEPGFRADQAVASWNLEADAAALIELRARTLDGTWHPWQEAAFWGGPGGRRSPAPPAGSDGQGPQVDGPTVQTDILTARSGELFDAAQLRITLLDGLHEATVPPPLHLAALSFSAPGGSDGDESDADERRGAEPVGAAAALQPLSQRAYPSRPDLGGGGPAWCSPTSLTMVLTAWGAQLPSAAPTEVPADADPRVPWMARAVYDAAFDGTGNWSFNAALAGEFGFDAVVTRLASLQSARVLTEAGIPLIASIAFEAGRLLGADYDTSGHLLVIRGFDSRGDVLVADPANPGGREGLRTYPREAFDAAWSRSRRTVYLITPRGHALPAVTDDGGW
ncbi:peptidase C39 family protein [Leifsonia sp. NPDC058292]|uniref:peptidase C39 family protein n=1 Tax=Leifsonia sp. NPDC058292 TaxID=3346428 RepID=UPI0036DDDC5F